MADSEPKGFDKAKSSAEDFVNDDQKTKHLLDEAEKKSEKNKSKLLSVWKELRTLILLVKAWRKGEYKGVSLKAKIYCIAAIIYFVNPFDFLPDFIPLWGFLDDATVIAFVIAALRKEIDKFDEWEKKRFD